MEGRTIATYVLQWIIKTKIKNKPTPQLGFKPMILVFEGISLRGRGNRKRRFHQSPSLNPVFITHIHNFLKARFNIILPHTAYVSQIFRAKV